MSTSIGPTIWAENAHTNAPTHYEMSAVDSPHFWSRLICKQPYCGCIEHWEQQKVENIILASPRITESTHHFTCSLAQHAHSSWAQLVRLHRAATALKIYRRRHGTRATEPQKSKKCQVIDAGIKNATTSICCASKCVEISAREQRHIVADALFSAHLMIALFILFPSFWLCVRARLWCIFNENINTAPHRFHMDSALGMNEDFQANALAYLNITSFNASRFMAFDKIAFYAALTHVSGQLQLTTRNWHSINLFDMPLER